MQWFSDNWVLVVLIGGVLVYLAMRRSGGGHGGGHGGGLFGGFGGGHGHGSRRSNGKNHGHGSHDHGHRHDRDDDQSKERGMDQAAPEDVSETSDPDTGNARDKRDGSDR